MNNIQGKYNIKAVSNLVGITTHTLRAWERRYGIIEPKRTESGHRLYTEEDVATLRWLKEQVEKGLHISKAVEILKEKQQAYSSQPAFVLIRQEADPLPSSQKEDTMSLIKVQQEHLIHALLSFNEADAHAILDRSMAIWQPDDVLHDIIIPVFIEIGDRWEKGEITVAHEHYASQLLNQRIQPFFRYTKINPTMPRVLTMAGPGEQHTIGITLFSLFLRQHGLDVYFLGADTPLDSVRQIVPELVPEIICISITLKENIPKLRQLIEDIHTAYPTIIFGVGGRAMESYSLPESLKPYYIGYTRNEWEKWLRRILENRA
ncbi:MULTISPECIES: MerR family transcriptional regulator [Aneurinibacillus]|jgi:DNA-binding transcriptional MerR regulator/methylmalonyl-CoA mutase cobalamin-binding subunit|uniref:MerR family transcriptional regulator n=1 Tax=Aneurinibacillus danicus TaxID=267746 RepID=A0A511VG42_9BACL|nr:MULTISPECIES: MerR family transcriptional regulator [Aneurinibacillus]GEN36533.1 MerR family transcriptional regulator [Aneurinibacillus danicus]